VGAIVVEPARVPRALHARRAVAPDVQGRLAVVRRAKTVDGAQVVHVVGVQVGEEDLVHPAQRDPHGGVVGPRAGAAVEDEGVGRVAALGSRSRAPSAKDIIAAPPGGGT
jgi:hypothetical protein